MIARNKLVIIRDADENLRIPLSKRLKVKLTQTMSDQVIIRWFIDMLGALTFRPYPYTPQPCLCSGGIPLPPPNHVCAVGARSAAECCSRGRFKCRLVPLSHLPPGVGLPSEAGRPSYPFVYSAGHAIASPKHL